jgi:hypothetical protein
MLVLVGILDTVTLGYPFASIARNVLYNLYYGVSDSFGIRPWYFYGEVMVALWGGAIAGLLLFAALGARRLPMLLAVAAVILAVHTLVGHKEYRFIYPALLLLTVLAGIGLAQAAALLEARLRLRGWASAVAVSAYWSVLCAEVAMSTSFGVLWTLVHDNLRAAALIEQSAGTCGIGLYGLSWTEAGGYTHFHRAVPMYWSDAEAELRAMAPGFNELVYTLAPPADLGFVTRQCFGGTCVAERSGQCAAVPPPAMPLPAPLATVPPPSR